MQLLDAGQQLATRPAPTPQIAPGWANNAPASSPPTIADPDTINALLAELLQFLTMTGQTASKTNTSQVAAAAEMLFGVYGIDSGSTGNQYIVTPLTPLPGLQDGQRVLFWSSRVNTGASTLQLAPLSAEPILYSNGGTIGAGVIASGINEVFWNAGLGAFVTAQPIATLSLPVVNRIGPWIVQMGVGTGPNSGTNVSAVVVTFPQAFPHALFGVFGTPNNPAHTGATGGAPTFNAYSSSLTQFTATMDTLGWTTYNQTVQFMWMAIGW